MSITDVLRIDRKRLEQDKETERVSWCKNDTERGKLPSGQLVDDCAVNSIPMLQILVGSERWRVRIPLIIDDGGLSLCLRRLPEKSTSLR